MKPSFKKPVEDGSTGAVEIFRKADGGYLDQSIGSCTTLCFLCFKSLSADVVVTLRIDFRTSSVSKSSPMEVAKRSASFVPLFSDFFRPLTRPHVTSPAASKW